MASRLAMRQNKTHRPKSPGKKRRDGSPDKSSTPSIPCEGIQQDAEGQKRPIVNDEILALHITEDDLVKVRESKPAIERLNTPVFNSVMVRKTRPTLEDNGRYVVVTRPAPRDSPVKHPDYSCLAGPRLDGSNNIIPHSILGDVEDFVSEAVRRGDLAVDEAMLIGRSSRCLTVKRDPKRPRSPCYPRLISDLEANALRNWERRMAERRCQQNYLAGLLNKRVDELVMNQSDNCHQVKRLHDLVERTAPFIERGTHNNVGAEFWKLQTNFGGELNGIHSTLTVTEKGFESAVDHVGVPCAVMAEKGLAPVSSSQIYKQMWQKTPYMRERLAQLEPLMNELDPHEPEIETLEIVGNVKQCDCDSSSGDNEGIVNNAAMAPCSTNADSVPRRPSFDRVEGEEEQDVGPVIQFGGVTGRWTGSYHAGRNSVGIEARVNFEAHAGERTMSFLEIGNSGTTVLYFNWKKVMHEKPFGMPRSRLQRFYFNQSSGVLLPGDAIKFPFIFKSPNAGIFSEQWEFQTHPVVCGGAKLLVTLRGVALKQDKYEVERTELEAELSRKQTEQIVNTVLDDLLSGIRTPERPRSPVDAHVTEHELFERKNPDLYFVHEKFSELNEIYISALPEEQKLLPWDLRVATVKEAILSLVEDDEEQESLLARYNDVVTSLSFRPHPPVYLPAYSAGYTILAETVDRIVDSDEVLRAALGMSDRSQSTGTEVPLPVTPTVQVEPSVSIRSKSMSSGAKSLTPADVALITVETPSDASSKAKGSKAKLDKKGGRDDKSKSLSVAGSSRRSSSTGRKQSSQLSSVRAGTGSQLTGSENVPSSAATNKTAATGSPSLLPTPESSSLLQTRYRTRLYLQTYLLLCDMADEMEAVFGELSADRDASSLSCTGLPSY